MENNKRKKRDRNANANTALHNQTSSSYDVTIAMLVDIEAGMAYRRDAEDRLVNHYLILCGAVFTFATIIAGNIKLTSGWKAGAISTAVILLLGVGALYTCKIYRNHKMYKRLGFHKYCFLKRLPINNTRFLEMSKGYGGGRGYCFSIASIWIIGIVTITWSFFVILLPRV